MKLNNTHRALYDAVSQIDPNLIEEATAPKRVLPSWKKVAAVAAVVALLIGAVFFWPVEVKTEDGQIVAVPGVLKVYACESKDMDTLFAEEYQLIEGVEPSYKTAWSPIINLLTRGVTLTLLVEEETLIGHQITYDVSVNCGELYGDVFHEKYREEGDPIGRENWDNAFWGKHGVGENGETIHWMGDELYFDRDPKISLEEAIEKVGRIHLDIIIKADGNIVGYAVLEMICTNLNLCIFNAVLVDSKFYPKVDGAFQNVAEEYVREQIAEKMKT